jgi:hypothetical protein
MPASYRALCSDFYVNQKLAVRMELPRGRETTLELFERVRREYPHISSFRKYKDELALESPAGITPHRWVALRAATLRSGVVNPDSEADMVALHRSVLEVAPYYLSISPLDVEYLEVLFGFDLAASGNHDAIVADALLGNSPLAHLLAGGSERVVEFQPMLGLALDADDDLAEVHFEVKTRSSESRTGRTEPISLYLTVRRYDPVSDLKHMPDRLTELVANARRFVDDRVVPAVLRPLRDAIASSGFAG